MSDFDLCKETLVGKRIIFLGSSVTYGACAMGQSFIEALEEKRWNYCHKGSCQRNASC